ncbi:MAG: lmo0937 family membrane protein [Patescibacteria group bacterium]
MLWTITAILIILWLFGFSFKVGGSFIHTLLVVALVVLAVQLLT